MHVLICTAEKYADRMGEENKTNDDKDEEEEEEDKGGNEAHKITMHCLQQHIYFWAHRQYILNVL